MARTAGQKKRHRWRQACAWAADTFPEVGRVRLFITPAKRMLKDCDGDPLEGLYDPNTGFIRVQAELSWREGLGVLWHELAHAMNRSRCKLPDPEDHDVHHGLNEWKIKHAWEYEGGHNDANDYPARWD